jgi:DNA-binding CsgD family transcriptional regulator
MELKHSFSSAGHLALDSALGEPYGWLSALYRSSALGVGICDRQLRFCAINDALASMHGRPAAANLGKTIHAVLGSAAAKVLPAFKQVFATGQPLSNLEVTAKLPDRDAPGHWNVSYFPIKNVAGEVQHVGAVALELTKRKEIESSILRITDHLNFIISALRNDLTAVAPAGIDKSGPSGDVFARAVRLLESCLSDTRAISQTLYAAPRLTAVQPLETHVHGRGHMPTAEGQDFVRAEPGEAESPLSAREREIAALLASGKSNKQIGSMLTISTRTVETHRAKIMLKLDLRSVGELVRYAVRNNLIQP